MPPRDRAARALLWATVATPALIVWPWPDAGFGAHAALKFAALAPAAAGWAWLARGETRWTGPERALAAVSLAAALAAPLTRQPLAGAATPLLSATCAWLIARGVRARFGALAEALEVAVASVALAVAAVALAEMLGLALPWAAAQRPQSTLANRNYVAGYLAIALPYACTASLRRPRAWLPAAGAIAAVLVATRCRSAYLASLAAAATATALVAAHALRRAPLDARPALPRRRLVALGATLALGAALGAAAPWPGVHFSQSAAQAAGRLFEHDQGSGRARLEQHRVGLDALGRSPSRWLFGAGPGAWEDVASAHAHLVEGKHAGMVIGPATPNSDALRLLVEQGLVGLAGVAAALALALRNLLRPAAGPLAARAAAAAGLAAAATHGLFDAPLFRAECVALLGVLLGAATAHLRPTAEAREASPLAPLSSTAVAPLSSTAVAPLASLSHIGFASLARTSFAIRAASRFAIVSGIALAALALARAASFVVAASVPMAHPAWDERQQAAARLLPRPDVYERLALVRARAGRCDEAAAALARLNDLRPHHWGARIEVSSCFTRAGRKAEARRLWDEARLVDEHLPDLVAALRAARRPPQAARETPSDATATPDSTPRP